MCLIAAAAKRKLHPEELSGLTGGVAGVICFTFSFTVLIDDHSLFHADTLLLSRVHYSERSNAGEKKGGALVGKRSVLYVLYTRSEEEEKGPSLHYTYTCMKKKTRHSPISARLNLSECSRKTKH